MTGAVAADGQADRREPGPVTWESRLLAPLPANTLSAALIIQAILLLGWAGWTLAAGQPVRLLTPDGGFIHYPLWFANLAAFGVTYGLIGFFRKGPDPAPIRALAPLAPDGNADALERRWRAEMAAAIPASRRAGALGAGIALAGSIAGMLPMVIHADPGFTLSRAWYFLVWIASFWVLFRGMALNLAENRMAVALVETGPVDLLDLRPLAAFGRRGVVGALSWVVPATGVALILVYPPLQGTVLGLAAVSGIIACLVLAVASFLVPLRIAHRRIVAAKAEALDQVRRAIRARLDGAGDGPALADLLAWEARLERVPDWPLDPLATPRLLGLLVMPMVGWTGSWALSRMLSGLVD